MTTPTPRRLSKLEVRVTKSDERKALSACVAYARLSAEIRRLGVEIGEHISKCPGVNGDLQPTPDDGWYVRVQKDFTHLKSAYTPDVEDNGWGGGEQVWLNDAEIIEELAECPHCLAAHKAIQARKAARKSLGAAKRAITMIGRAALKMEQD